MRYNAIVSYIMDDFVCTHITCKAFRFTLRSEVENAPFYSPTIKIVTFFAFPTTKIEIFFVASNIDCVFTKKMRSRDAPQPPFLNFFLSFGDLLGLYFPIFQYYFEFWGFIVSIQLLFGHES